MFVDQLIKSTGSLHYLFSLGQKRNKLRDWQTDACIVIP